MRLKLRELRKKNGWTIYHLADVSGLSTPFISQLENGKRMPSAETLLTLSETFSVPMAALIEDEGLGADLPALIDDLMQLGPKELAAVRLIVRSMLPTEVA